MGWVASRDVEQDARGTPTLKGFYPVALAVHADHPDWTHHQVIEAVQRSGNAAAYAQWRTEADRTVTKYGLAGGDVASDAAALAANRQSMFLDTSGTDYQFTRGSASQTRSGKPGWKHESTWDCLGRLADEVNFRRFFVENRLYWISEIRLFKQKAIARISEETVGVNWINGDYDTGKHNAVVTIEARASRWSLPQGSAIELFDMGVFDGKWLVSSVDKPIFSPDITITLTKPRPVLPEPAQQTDGYADITLPPADPDRDKWVELAPGADRSGNPTKDPVLDFFAAVGQCMGKKITITTGTNHNQYVAGSSPPRESQHWRGWAGDTPGTGEELGKLGFCALTTAGMDIAAADALVQRGRRGEDIGFQNVNGYNIGFYTNEGGNHWNHLHVGIPEVAGASGDNTSPQDPSRQSGNGRGGV